jgi:hypothetical protein
MQNDNVKFKILTFLTVISNFDFYIFNLLIK